MPNDDTQIMLAVASGDFDQFEILVKRYWSALNHVAVSKVGDASIAEDIVQECFLSVFAARKTYKSEFAFRTWLWTILLNRCRRYFSRKQHRPRQVPRSQFGEEFAATLPNEPIEIETGLTLLLQAERRDQLIELLNELPEPQADALRLRFFGNLKFAEIADAMNSSVSGAKRRVKLGLIKLSEELLAREPDETPGTTPNSEHQSQGTKP